ncbi:MAG: hypothetical protein SP4CHLAM5_02070 [Chlamydiia bacterium]|nr:hypothetical protein [Chlamydiia bacterium]MCH9618081.1 hypothetical protein [Chlamydiia bacterium]MCH9624199.1 hypothetical protein [Chlamydiia bacterium]
MELTRLSSVINVRASERAAIEKRKEEMPLLGESLNTLCKMHGWTPHTRLQTLRLNVQGLIEEKAKARKTSPIILALKKISLHFNDINVKSKNRLVQKVSNAIFEFFARIVGKAAIAKKYHLAAIKELIAENKASIAKIVAKKLD